MDDNIWIYIHRCVCIYTTKHVTLPQEAILTSLSGVINASSIDYLQMYSEGIEKKKNKLAHARMLEAYNNINNYCSEAP